VIREARVFADVDALTRALAEESLRVAREAIEERGRCAVCLSGGNTPRALNELWARDYQARMPWSEIHLFWGDERYIPPEDPRSNYRMARETLIGHVNVPPGQVHPMPTHFERPEDAAKDYEGKLRQFFGTLPTFDILFLGVGEEGHTASIFPKSAAVAEKDHLVMAVSTPADPPTRLTLTLAAINCARNVFFLSTGAAKREIVSVIRREPPGAGNQLPAAMVRPAGRVVWFLDEAAAF